MHKEERLARKAAPVAVILDLGFRAHSRGQARVTFPFIFKSSYWSVTRDTPVER